MEVDGGSDIDIDQSLMQQFSNMGTTDREVLISEFQRLLGNKINAAGCAFFLDMNNWNLQNAVCAYYDLEQPSCERLPNMSFVGDVTIGEGESVPPGTAFVKTWRVQNKENDTWPPGCNLCFIQGERMGGPERVMIASLGPGETRDISVHLVSPAQTGIYQSQWKMRSPTGAYFGDVIWAIVVVEESGVLGVTQQMSKIGTGALIGPQPAPAPNPFGLDAEMEEGSTYPAQDQDMVS